MSVDTEVFAAERPKLLALAYRMLGEVARAEDVVQDAWLRWQGRSVSVDHPGAYLVKMVTRLCLNELDSARARREQARGDRLPEPIALEEGAAAALESLETVSMAFLVVLQRLTPAERAVFLLHEVFDFGHGDIAELVGKSEPACRQLLKRAKTHVAAERRTLQVPKESHRRMLRAFLKAAAAGDAAELSNLLADDVVLVADAGPDGGTYGRVRNLPGPLVGVTKVAAFVAAVTVQGSEGLETLECELNGTPAIAVFRAGRPYTAILLSVADDRIRGIFLHADPTRLGSLGRLLG